MGLSTGLGLPGPFRQREEDGLPWLACLSGLLKSREESVFRLRSEVPLDCTMVP